MPAHGVLFHGSVIAAGYFFPNTSYQEVVLERILAMWTAGVMVYRHPDGYVLLLAQPSRVHTDLAPGIVLVSHQGSYVCSRPDANQTFQRGDVILPRGGVLTCFTPGPDNLVHPGELINLRLPELMELEPLGPPPSPPVEETAEPVLEVHQIFDVPQLSQAARNHWSAISNQQALSKQTGSSGADTQLAPSQAGSVQPKSQNQISRSGGGSLINRGKGVWKRLFGRKDAALAPAGASSGGSVWKPSANHSQPRKMLFSKFFEQMALLFRGNRYFSEQQAKYTRDLFDMFRSDHLEEALRHSIPLKSDGLKNPVTSFSRPQPRESLDLLNMTQSMGSTDFGMGFIDMMKALYEEAFAKLDGAGKVDLAAYVLAHLLDEPKRAAAYLMTHQRYELAAKLAELRELDPDLIVTAWMLAGNLSRAQLLARKLGNGLSAAAMLETRDPKMARSFRLTLAHEQARAGDFEAAIALARPNPEAAELVQTWTQTALDQEHLPGARLLAQAAAYPETQRTRELMAALITGEDPDDAQRRQVFLEAIREVTHHQTWQGWLRQLWRVLIKDHGACRLDLNRDMLGAIINSDEKVLYQEMVVLKNKRRALTPAELPRSRRTPLILNMDSPGVMPIHDALRLPKKRVLVAMGESGARLLDRNGHVLRHFNHPAYHLIGSDLGNRIILAAPRGAYLELTRLNLETGHTKPWLELKTGLFADTYNGLTWFVVLDNEVLGLDATADGFKVIWKIDDLGGRVTALKRSRQAFSFQVEGDTPTLFRYRLPQLTCAERRPLNQPVRLVSAAGALLREEPVWSVILKEPHVANANPLPIQNRWSAIESAACSNTWCVILARTHSTTEVTLIDLSEFKVRVIFKYPEHAKVRYRFNEKSLTLINCGGVVCDFNLTTGRIIHQYQVRIGCVN